MEKLNILQMMPRWRMAVLLAVVALVGIRVCGQGLPAPVYPVVHDRQWYEERNFIYQWTDERGISHYSNLLETATNPHQIEAMLKYVYVNPEIPGLLYAIPDSARMVDLIMKTVRLDFASIYNKQLDSVASGVWDLVSQRKRNYVSEYRSRMNNMDTLLENLVREYTQ